MVPGQFHDYVPQTHTCPLEVSLITHSGFPVSVCMCVCMLYMFVYAWVCAHMHAEATGQCLLSQSLDLTNSARLSGQQAQGSSYLCLQVLGITGACHHAYSLCFLTLNFIQNFKAENSISLQKWIAFWSLRVRATLNHICPYFPSISYCRRCLIFMPAKHLNPWNRFKSASWGWALGPSTLLLGGGQNNYASRFLYWLC